MKTEEVDMPPVTARGMSLLLASHAVYLSNFHLLVPGAGAHHPQPTSSTMHVPDQEPRAEVASPAPAPAGGGFRAPLQRYGASRNLQEMSNYSYMGLHSQQAIQHMEARVAFAQERLNNELENLRRLRNRLLQNELGRNTAHEIGIASNAQAGPSRVAGISQCDYGVVIA
jgi:hypothetical protein